MNVIAKSNAKRNADAVHLPLEEAGAQEGETKGRDETTGIDTTTENVVTISTEKGSDVTKEKDREAPEGETTGTSGWTEIANEVRLLCLIAEETTAKETAV